MSSRVVPGTEPSPKPMGGSGVHSGPSVSPSDAEKRATPSGAPAASTTITNATTASPVVSSKLRSCVVCRSRKVRCDKQSPCSNCRRANIACVFPSVDRPPRWARRLELVAQNAAAGGRSTQAADSATQVMERLRNLEDLVKTLSGQLEQAQAQAQTNTGSSTGNSPSSSTHDPDAEHQRATTSATTNTSKIQSQFGRLVLNDASRSRYVSSGFWSRVNDEVRIINSAMGLYPSSLSSNCRLA